MAISQEPSKVPSWSEFKKNLQAQARTRPMLVASPEDPAAGIAQHLTYQKPGHIETLARNAGERHTADEMNGLEKRYAAYLETRRLVGEIINWRFEPLKLKLAPSTFYNVDFSLIFPDGRIELHETKGFWRDDARVKIKVAAAMFTEYRFVAVQWKGKAGGWKFEEFSR